MAREFVDRLKFVDPLRSQDAFKGGRSETTKLVHKISADESIRYYDINSLYPYILKTGLFPRGVSTILSFSPKLIIHALKLSKVSSNARSYLRPVCTTPSSHTAINKSFFPIMSHLFGHQSRKMQSFRGRTMHERHVDVFGFKRSCTPRLCHYKN